MLNRDRMHAVTTNEPPTPEVSATVVDDQKQQARPLGTGLCLD